MLRLIHAQTVQGAILVDDIDDGLPNKMTHRLGSAGDPKAYKRDGYANEPKQKCYIPRTKPTDASLPGYIDVTETEKALFSSGKGKIFGLKKAGLISVVSLTAADLAAPTISAATLNTPMAGDVTIDGANFLSVSPNITSVKLTGAGVGSVTLTKAQIVAVAPGAVSNTQIIIDSTLVPGLTTGDVIKVTADDQTTAGFTV